MACDSKVVARKHCNKQEKTLSGRATNLNESKKKNQERKIKHLPRLWDTFQYEEDRVANLFWGNTLHSL